MTEVQALDLIESTFRAGWTAIEPLVPLILENESFPSSDEFAMLTTAMLGATQRTTGRAGTRKVMREGWIMVKLWSAVDTGMTRPAQLADEVRGILEMQSLPSPIAGDDPVTTKAEVWSRRGGASEGTDGRWYMQLVRVPFYYFEMK